MLTFCGAFTFTLMFIKLPFHVVHPPRTRRWAIVLTLHMVSLSSKFKLAFSRPTLVSGLYVGILRRVRWLSQRQCVPLSAACLSRIVHYANTTTDVCGLQCSMRHLYRLRKQLGVSLGKPERPLPVITRVTSPFVSCPHTQLLP